MMDNLNPQNLRCPYCPEANNLKTFSPIQKSMIDALFHTDVATMKKYLMMLNRDKVLKNKRIYHCPVTDCVGIVDPSVHPALRMRLTCDYCSVSVCANCQKEWHEGKKCEKEVQGEAFHWDAVGDVTQ